MGKGGLKRRKKGKGGREGKALCLNHFWKKKEGGKKPGRKGGKREKGRGGKLTEYHQLHC